MKPETKKIIKKLKPRSGTVISAYESEIWSNSYLAPPNATELVMLDWLAIRIDFEIEKAQHALHPKCANRGKP